MTKGYFQMHVSFTEDFQDTFQMFMKIISADKNIKASIDPVHIKKGMLSPAIRNLITDYVEENKEAFLSMKRSKIKEGDSDAA
jgi:hypothetical protein